MRIAVSLLLVLLVAVAAAAASDQKDHPKITLEVRDAQISSAVTLLFAQTGLSYSLSSDVKGTVTARVVDQPLEVALKAILSPLGATWKKTGPVYTIVKKIEPQSVAGEVIKEPESQLYVPPSDEAMIEKIPLNFIDGYELVSMLQGQPRLWENITDNGRTQVFPVPPAQSQFFGPRYNQPNFQPYNQPVQQYPVPAARRSDRPSDTVRPFSLEDPLRVR